jgi:hypothetical protein
LIGSAALQLVKVLPTLLAALAFGAHSLVNDHALHRQYGRGYERGGRWLFAGSIILGWVVTALWQPPVTFVVALRGFLSGGVILNTIKEELPDTKEGKFRALLIGAVSYAALLLALAYSQQER